MRLVEIGLKELNNLVAKAADLSMEAFDTALHAVKEPNKEEKRLKVKELVNQLRSLREEIDELSLEIIARYQPLASELRRVKASMELGYAFLRFGRYSYDALAAFTRAEKLGVECKARRFDEMAPIVREMMEGAIKSLKTLDVLLALKVISKDDEVDKLYHKYLSEIMRGEDVEGVACAVVEALAIKFLERAADHSVHVAAQTVFIAEGRMPE